jgi:hypothetical protein
MEGAERDTTQDWLLPEGAAPPLLGELELKVDEALAIARASEEGVGAVGEVALHAARQARRAAGLAESASAAAWEAQRAVAVAVPGRVASAADARAEVEPELGNGDYSAVDDEQLRHFIERADRVAARLRAVSIGSG